MLKLTSPKGDRIIVMKSWVQMARKPLPKEYIGLDVNCVLVLSGAVQAVRESLDEVQQALE